ncbi:MAG TPA: bifunctional precorrin-2 dehydrogenase/sirohydrochlorin ferrochelatase [Spirochaetota bacterium]|nr:bifunctional precorrin-2 dehydrogenase/sirohydrochlorin ferrochelatase [Spirochaetota bacterium]HPF07219.1 bifunctional precorrin-2 dehydrogenase/sirohydrochlorin ferrochelatase [Spirochaetota bacterium]HPJ43162.1 bifunctional precorrin-2 dehydrogenase/sirohydrochlorin ferrochelatase [Spirochaetota bacterium]HRX48697.1 bifunctional precorrin-2 dehydrogenase/sirohydrochlorin ferrochelatase [Spirochaetota bacterium]
MKLYPVMVNMEGRLAVVVGGGSVAARKVADLLDSGARVKVVSPEINNEIVELSKDNELQIVKREYEYGDLEGAALVFSATNDRSVNELVFMEAEGLNIFINAVDDPENCSFYVPSFTRRGDFLFALSTAGAAPAYAARIRRELEKQIPEEIDVLLDKLRRAREILKNEEVFSDLESPDRGDILKKVANSDELLDSLKCCKDDEDIIKCLSGVKNSCGD